MSSLRSSLIRLAHQQPALRPHLLPVLASGVRAVMAGNHVELTEANGMVYVTGPYHLMADNVNPRLKSQGFRWDGGARRWEILASKLTPLKRKNLLKLIEPLTAAGAATSGADLRSPKQKADDEMRRRKNENLCIDVPFELGDKAKSLGGLWDQDTRTWYMPDTSTRQKVLDEVEADREQARQVALRHMEQERERVEAERKRLGLKTYYEPGDSRGDHPAVGQTFKDRKTGEFMTVVDVKSVFYREDGLSFGLPDDTGWMHTITAKPSEDETAIQGIRDREQRELTVAQARNRRKDLVKLFRDRGDFPSTGTDIRNEDRLVVSGRNSIAYGGGDWFVITPSHIWFVQNNGGDGDDWGANNIVTGGAGAMGWRMPRTDELAQELQQLDALIGER